MYYESEFLQTTFFILVLFIANVNLVVPKAYTVHI